MKSLSKILLLLAMGTLMSACNEKISPELQTGNSTVIPPVTAPDTYFFRVVNDSPVILNYVLHRTGAGRYGTAKWECAINSTGVPLSSDLYIGQSAVAHQLRDYDISCFMDAEELSLAFNGMSLKIEASKNTCEYVGYAPYSYYDAIPGSSSATYMGITCEDGTGITNTHAIAVASGIGATYGAGTGIGCGYMVDITVPVANRVARLIPTDSADLCAFNYSANGGGNSQNCDIGKIKFNITQVYNAQTTTGGPVIPAAKAVPTGDYSCGGTIPACVGGAIKEVPDLASSVGSSIISMTQTNQEYSKVWTQKKVLNRTNTVDIANYRRGLASLNLNYGDYTVGNQILWGDATYNKDFDPTLMEKYAANRNPDDTPIIDLAGGAAVSTVSNATYVTFTQRKGWTETPLAADPFLGTSKRTNPFYTYYCLDRAMEIKARIRIAVRDWDKVFPSTTTDLELISDVYKTIGSRRQDLPSSEEEIPNDPGDYNYYNDKDDWDNYIPMVRTDPNGVGVYDPTYTFWFPQPTVSYPTGFFNPFIFTNQGPNTGELPPD